MKIWVHEIYKDLLKSVIQGCIDIMQNRMENETTMYGMIRRNLKTLCDRGTTELYPHWIDASVGLEDNPKPYLDPPMSYLFGSLTKNPNQKTIPNPKRNYIGGTR